MSNREINRLKNRFSYAFEPFAIILLIALFILPTLAVLNLTPLSSKSKMNSNVLGVKDREEIGLALVGGIHDIFKTEFLNSNTIDIYSYNSDIIKHSKGRYSKPILEITNFSSQGKKVQISSNSTISDNSIISLIYNDQIFVLQNTNGNTFTKSINLKEKSKDIIYLQLESFNNVRYNGEISITISSITD